MQHSEPLHMLAIEDLYESPPRALAAVLDLPTFILAWDKHHEIWDNANKAHMALIWLKSCPCLSDDNHGVVANIELCGNGQCRDTMHGRSTARSVTTDGNQR